MQNFDLKNPISKINCWNCSKIALKLLWNCSEIALKLLWNCSEIAFFWPYQEFVINEMKSIASTTRSGWESNEYAPGRGSEGQTKAIPRHHRRHLQFQIIESGQNIEDDASDVIRDQHCIAVAQRQLHSHSPQFQKKRIDSSIPP